METFISNEHVTTIFMLLLMVSLIFFIKYIHGDFSPVSIEELNRDELTYRNEKGEIVGKKILYYYKYTYKDGRIKFKTKITNF